MIPESEAPSTAMPSPTVSDPSVSSAQSSSPRDASTSQPRMASLGATVDCSEAPDSSDAPDSFLTRFILTPLRMISFLLSLALIDRRNRSYRDERHSPVKSTPLARMTQALFFPWYEQEPYSDMVPGPRKDGSDRAGDSLMGRKEKEGWTMKGKHRKMIKMEIEAAVGIRMRVVVGLVILSVASGVVGVLVITMLWRMWKGRQGVA